MLGRLLRYLLGIVLVLVVLVAGVGIYAATELNKPAAAPGQPQQLFSIDSDESVVAVATRMEQEHLIGSSFLFRVMLKLRGAEANVKAGDFQLSPSMTPEQIIAAITVAPTDAGSQVTIPEGYRIEQIADLLAGDGLIDRDRFMTVVVTGTYSYEWLPQNRSSAGDLEGYLFPDTYSFPRHGADREERILGAMLANFDRRVGPDLRAKVAAGPYSLHDVLTIAAIVEREAKMDDERPIIAGVFYNRLDRGMQLDADPTVQYAQGKSGDWWPQLHPPLQAVDSPYNTYVITGLPPGPIANPGLASINAAITPTNSEMLYFVACGGGRHVFAATLEEQERNIARCE